MGNIEVRPSLPRLLLRASVVVTLGFALVGGSVAWALDEPTPSPTPSVTETPLPSETPSSESPTPDPSAPDATAPGEPPGAPGGSTPRPDAPQADLTDRPSEEKFSDRPKQNRRDGQQRDPGTSRRASHSPFEIDLKRDSLRTATIKARSAAAAAHQARELYRLVSREERATEQELRTALRSQEHSDLALQQAVRLINASPDAGALVADPGAATLITAVQINSADAYLPSSATLTGFSESLAATLDQAGAATSIVEAAQVAALARREEARQALLAARAAQRDADRAVRQAKAVFLRVAQGRPSAAEAWWMRQYASSELGAELAALNGGPQVSLVLAAPTGGTVTSPFGMRRHPILDTRKLHSGVDFAGASTIQAAASGVVVRADFDVAYGNYVVVLHGQHRGDSVATLYAHCASLNVARGDRVRVGDTLGSVGATGYATGPHLHFELRLDGRPIDPVPFLR